MKIRISYETHRKPLDEAARLLDYLCGNIPVGINETRCTEHCCAHYLLPTMFTVVRPEMIMRVIIYERGIFHKKTRVVIDLCADSTTPVYALYSFLAELRKNPSITVKRC